MDYQQRRQHKAQLTRQAILDAAVSLASEVGFEKLNIRDVCARAGVTTGAFYHHFKSKDDLLNQGFSSLDSYLESALTPYDAAAPLERLEALLKFYTQYMEELGWETMALYYTRRLASPTASSVSPRRYTLRAMEACLTELSQGRVLDPDYSPQWVADFLFRHFRGVVIDWILHRGSYSLWDKLVQDFAFFQLSFQADRPGEE